MTTQNCWNNQVTAAAVTFNGGVTSIGTDAAANAINIGTGGAAKTITIGNGTGATSVVVNCGTGALDIGTNAFARTTTIGNTTGASVLALKYGTGDFTLASATGTVMSALDTGEITYPLQSAFFAYLSGDRLNVTGDSTSYTVSWGAEIFDQNADFDGTSTFTAPVTGRYAFFAQCYLGGILGTHTSCYMIINTSNRAYYSNTYNLANASAGGQFYTPCSVIADMDAGDTAVVIITVQAGTKVVDIVQDTAADPRSWFQGHLIC